MLVFSGGKHCCLGYKAKMRALLTEELLRLGTAQARAAEEQAGPPPRGKPKKC